MSARVSISFYIPPNCPPDAAFEVLHDNCTGTIDGTHLLTPSRRPLLESVHGRVGFGYGRFGLGSFGHGGGSVPNAGFGAGRFGEGYFGYHVPQVRYVSAQPLTDGVYRFAVRIVDRQGNTSTAVETVAVVAADPPPPPRSARLVSCVSGVCTLAWTPAT